MAYTTINKSTDYFNTKLYTGNGGTQSISSVGFQPDWTWLKQRNGTSNHRCYDAVRGATKQIYPNLTNAENTDTNGLTSFDSDGFSLGNESGHNGSGQTYVAWNWLANGAGSSNTDGSITSTVSVNTTSGFSIVTYSGTGSAGTVGHGLGSVPKMMIIKNRDNTQGWATYHHTQGAGNYLDLSSTNTVQAGSSIFNNTTPTSSVFSVATSGWTNDSGNNIIAYCFAEKKGFSKFGSYTGNGNADGTFVYTGFKPAFIMSKMTSSADNWVIQDNQRLTYNSTGYTLNPNANNVENTNYPLDILSNGFKQRTANATTNQSGQTFIYMAFAEAPLVGTNGVTAKAR